MILWNSTQVKEFDKRESLSVLRGVMFGFLCSVPFWARLIWEFTR